MKRIHRNIVKSRVSTKRSVIALSFVVTAATATVVWAGAVSHQAPKQAIQLLGQKTPRSAMSVNHPVMPISTVNGTTSYEPQSLTVSAPPGGYSAAVSSAAVLSSLKSQAVPNGVLGSTLDSSAPSITLSTVTEGSPSYPGLTAGSSYPAWVVVYHNTSPTSYGPVAVPTTPDCDFVGVYDLKLSAWTTFFQDCPQ